MYVTLFQHSQIIDCVLSLFIVLYFCLDADADEGFDFWIITLIVGSLLIIFVIPIICWVILPRMML